MNTHVEELVEELAVSLETEYKEIQVKPRNSDDAITFNVKKIEKAITMAFLAEAGIDHNSDTITPDGITESSRLISKHVAHTLTERAEVQRRNNNYSPIDIESIQDQVEIALMRFGHHSVARKYIIYREEKAQVRKNRNQDIECINVTLDNGKTIGYDKKMISMRIKEACSGIKDVESTPIYDDVIRNLYNGLTQDELFKSLVMSARTLIEKEPNYSKVAARLLLQEHYHKVCEFLSIIPVRNNMQLKLSYPTIFKQSLQRGVDLGMISKELLTFDLEFLGQQINSERDRNFEYLGIQTLYDRYFLHHDEVRYELPQCFFMRVAMGLCIQEGKNKNKYALEIYNLLSNFDYMTSTPTLFNSGTVQPQLSSCFLTTIDDSLEGIYKGVKDNALLSKYAGGLGNDWTNVRASGSYIKGTNGKSLGIVPFLNVADATAIAVNQGGKRKGAVCSYLECWHLDFESYLELRKNTGDERRRTHDMNTASWIPDLFMQRLEENGDWTLFCPSEAPDLHDSYGAEFKEKYLAYEEQASRNEINSRSIPAKQLWRKMLSMLFETGHPWITFKDPCNLRSPITSGIVHSSNLCTEITLPTNKDEIAVCNLGSINLIRHLDADGNLNKNKLKKTIKTAIRALDNVVDINFYSVPEARNSNLVHRPIGLGIMGFHEALQTKGIPYASNEAVNWADECMELISYYAISSSNDLAKEKGKFKSFANSLWDQGILPIDSIKLVAANRGSEFEQNQESRLGLDWDGLRKKVQKYGMRNSNVMAIAPTATIANICGVSMSIDPIYKHLFVKSNLSGEFTVYNMALVNKLKEIGLWDKTMVQELKYYDGSIDNISRIPTSVKEVFANAFEIDPDWLIKCGSRRQKWLDQSQSLNLYLAKPSGKKLDSMYRLAWKLGLKTTYYLRSMGASSTEKSTIEDSSLNMVKREQPKVCSITDPDCEACE